MVQETWIQQATVQSNILFGRDMQPAFYQQVVTACALQEVNTYMYMHVHVCMCTCSCSVHMSPCVRVREGGWKASLCLEVVHVAQVALSLLDINHYV